MPRFMSHHRVRHKDDGRESSDGIFSCTYASRTSVVAEQRSVAFTSLAGRTSCAVSLINNNSVVVSILFEFITNAIGIGRVGTFFFPLYCITLHATPAWPPA